MVFKIFLAIPRSLKYFIFISPIFWKNRGEEEDEEKQYGFNSDR